MELIECRKIIKKYYMQHLKNILFNKQLILKNVKYSIRPDEYFVFENKITVIEYEKTKRPVESISKYWWLLHKTDWLINNMEMSLIFISLNPKTNKIRKESILLLGKELEAKFINNFHFYFVDSIQLKQIPLNKLLPNQRAQPDSVISIGKLNIAKSPINT